MRQDYRTYMDNMSVDTGLHNRIMNRLKHKPTPRAVMKRCIAVVASAALLAACIWAIPLLLPQDSPLPPEIPTVNLIFNPTQSVASARKYIPGYFIQELTQDEKALLGVEGSTTMKGFAGFSGEGILKDVSFSSNTNTSTIILAKGPILLDYRFPGEPQVTDVNGVAVTAGHWTNNGETLYYASFVHGSTGYHLELLGDEGAMELTALVNKLIINEPADLSLIQPSYIPEWYTHELTLNQAKADPSFGAYVPEQIPTGFRFDSAARRLNQFQDELKIRWVRGMKSIEWTITNKTADHERRLVDITRPETYDLSLYSIPHYHSVPQELREIVESPVFQAKDITIEIINARAYTLTEAGDTEDPRMRFSVLYGDVVIELHIKGLQPEAVLEMLQSILQ